MIRKLEKEDYHKGFLDLINYFTQDPKSFTYDEFINIFKKINNSLTLVIEENNIIIATGKLIIEQKFHNNFAKMGHIEDVVVSEQCRGKGYGNLLMKKIIEIGKERGYYKMVLNCNSENIEYYKKLGFIKKGTEMSLYF